MEKSKKEKRAKSLLQSKKSDYSKTKEDMEEKRKKERVKNQRECSLAEERENHFNKGNQWRKIESQSNWKSNSVGRTRGRIGMSKALKEREKRRVIQEERKNNKVKKAR